MVKLNTMVLRIAMTKPRKQQENPDLQHRINCPTSTNANVYRTYAKDNKSSGNS